VNFEDIEQLVECNPSAATVTPPSDAPTFVLVPGFQLLHAANGVALLQAAIALPIPAKPSTATASAFIFIDFMDFLPSDTGWWR